MFGKIEIIGKITVETGMHIGTSGNYAAIGAIDSPVIRDPITDLPMIPGSSLKGKMRTLLAKQYNQKLNTVAHDDDDERITNLFGCGKSKSSPNPKASKLIFSDSIMSNMKELEKMGIKSPTEAKEENSINRLTAIANPRQIERTIRGAEFPLLLIYEATETETILEEIKVIGEGLKLLSYDYIGGHGSRGYGRVSFSEIDLEIVVGDVDESILEDCRKVLKECCDEV